MNQKEIKKIKEMKSLAKRRFNEYKKTGRESQGLYWQGRLHALEDVLKLK